MILYISGPMTGYPNFNRGSFAAAKEYIEQIDQLHDKTVTEILSPADITQGESEEGLHEADKPWGFYMRQAVKMLMEADQIVMLPGWEDSKGARREFDLAVDLGMQVWHIVFEGETPTGIHGIIRER